MNLEYLSTALSALRDLRNLVWPENTNAPIIVNIYPPPATAAGKPSRKRKPKRPPNDTDAKAA